VRRRAHTIKGAAGNVSATALGRVALEAEQAATANRLDDVAGLLPRLEQQLERLKLALDNAGWN
jgi:HPt (histidine-containing phosphotransfer) domain-containing protein